MVGRCDDTEWEVTLLIPHVYRIRAADAGDAKDVAAERWTYAVKPDAVGFPVEMTVKEVESAKLAADK